MASGRNGRRGRYGGGAPVNKAAGGTGPGADSQTHLRHGRLRGLQKKSKPGEAVVYQRFVGCLERVAKEGVINELKPFSAA